MGIIFGKRKEKEKKSGREKKPAVEKSGAEIKSTPAPPYHMSKPVIDIVAIASPFNSLIGMDSSKAVLVDNLAANQTGRVPLLSMVVLAPAGTGKTALCKALCKARAASGAAVLEILPSAVREKGKPWDAVVNFLAAPGPKTLFVDEAHELYDIKRTVQLAKLAALCMGALDGNRPDNQNVKFSNELEIGFNRHECQIVLATNFPGKMPEALTGKSGRAFRLELPLYSDGEIAQIAHLMLSEKGIKGNAESLESLARVARGSARPLEHLTGALFTRAVLEGKSTVNKEDIQKAMVTCSLFPMGFSKEEVRCLHFLQSANTQAVLAARFPNLDTGSLRNFMSHALGNGLIGKTNGGFILTDKGRRYFTDCLALKFPVPVLA
jgi:Holliday junction resolvasome RuvABC ATP-dependent DNA helicase subunit